MHLVFDESLVNTVVRMEKVSSVEHIAGEDMAPRRVLKSIWLRMRRGQVWGVYAPTRYESALLLEIIGNVRPYEDGKCVLMERGMMRRKRLILQHVFYIGSADMLYENMNVLEYLMFACAREKQEPVSMQETLFEWLVSIGLADISLTPIRWLDDEEKAVVILMAAACSKSSIIVFNLPQIVFSDAQILTISHIAKRIRQDGKTMIISTSDSGFIEHVCTHTAYIARGHVIYQGSVDYMRQHFDPYAVIIRGDNLHNAEDELKQLFPDYRIDMKNQALYIGGCSGTICEPRIIFSRIIEAGFVPEQMQINSKTVKNALEEINKRYDL